ncbi:MAG TPA: hypothetical protein VF834_14030 [Streptosporangiaceae bacterium]
MTESRDRAEPVPAAGSGGPVTTAVADGQAHAGVVLSESAPSGGQQPRGLAARRDAAGRVLRRHWLAAALLAAGLVLRLLVQFAYRPALFYIDTSRYLYDAQGNDPVGYKAPLRAILAVANFNAVAAVQHLLGLAMAVVIYGLLLRRGLSRWLAALAIAPLLLDAYQLQSEQTIMPGTWFEALIVASLAILAWQQRAGWRRVVAAGVVLGTSATFAQVGEALLLPAVIYLLASGGGWRHTIGKAAALCAAFALPIVAYSTGSKIMTGSFFLSHTGVTSFYGRTAAAADCGTLRLPAVERGMCPTKAQQARGPDWLEYGKTSPIRPYYANPALRGAADSEIANFNNAVLTQQPQRLLAAYGRDVLKLYALSRVTSPGDTPISRWQFHRYFPYFTSQTPKSEVLRSIRAFGGGTPRVWMPVASFLRSYQRGGGYAPGPLLAILTLTGLAGSVVAFRRRAASGVRQLALACLLFFGSAAFVLLVSDLFEFSWRYQLPVLVTLVPAGALGIGVITTSIRAWRGSPR